MPAQKTGPLPGGKTLEQYESWLRVNYSSADTRSSYYNTAAKFLSSTTSFSSDSIGAMARSYIESLITGGKLTPSSILQKKHGLKAFLRFLEDRGVITTDDVSKFGRTKTPQNLREEPCVMSREEFDRLVEFAIDPIDKAQLLLTWDLGLRVSELMALTVEDLTAKSGFVRVLVSKRREGAKYSYTPVEIGTLKAAHKCMLSMGVQSGLLFPPPMTKYRPMSMLRRLCERAGVHPADKQYYNIHSLRHGRAMELLRLSDYNFDLVQKMLRHTSGISTRWYATLLPSDVMKLMVQMKRKRGLPVDYETGEFDESEMPQEE